MEKSENIDEQLPDQLATNSDPTEETKQRTTTGNATVSLKNKNSFLLIILKCYLEIANQKWKVIWRFPFITFLSSRQFLTIAKTPFILLQNKVPSTSPGLEVVGVGQKESPIRLPIKIVEGAGTVIASKPVAMQVGVCINYVA